MTAAPPEPGQRSRSGRLWLRIALLAVAIVVLWPAQWGGITSLAVVEGDSMEPAYSAGSLAVAVRDPFGYSVGQTVVFTPPVLNPSGVRIVHRLSGTAPDGSFTTSGDNAETNDPWLVPAGDIDGIVLFAIPGVGQAAAKFIVPMLLGTAAGAILMIILWPRRRPEDDQPARIMEPEPQGGPNV